MSSQETLPYIGSRISLISNSDIRYEGILVSIDTDASTASLKNVQSFGSEGRRVPDIPPSPEIFDSIVFKGQDIKDLTVCEPDQSVQTPPQSEATPLTNTQPPKQGSYMPSMDYTQDQNNMPQNRPINTSDKPQYKYNNNNSTHTQPPTSHVYHWEYNVPQYQRRHINYNNRRVYSVNRRNRFTVGQLISQPNEALKNELSSDFDFDEANSKFEKSKVMNGHTEDTNQTHTHTQFGGYNKQSSFFDNISCESLDRKQGREERPDKEKQRALDKDTFGDIITHIKGPRHTYRRGGGGDGGRGHYNWGRYRGNAGYPPHSVYYGV